MIRALLALALLALGIQLPSAVGAQEAAAPRLSSNTRYILDATLKATPPAGVAEYAAALKSLEAEFAPQRVELKSRTDAIDGLERRYRRAVEAQDPEGARKIYEQAEEAQRALRLWSEAMNERRRLRSAAVLDPVFERINRGVVRFARARGYSDIRFAYDDAMRFRDAGAIDVTADFVGWYAANPAS